MPYWSIILLDCLVILFSGLLVYALNNGIFATMGIFWHLSLTWGVCLVPYLVGFRLFRTYSGIIRYSSFVDLQRVGFAVLFGAVCVVSFQELTDFSPYLVYTVNGTLCYLPAGDELDVGDACVREILLRDDLSSVEG